MLDVEQRSQKDRRSSLAQWIQKVIGQTEVYLNVQYRGKKLHILCESPQSIEAKKVVKPLLELLQQPEGKEKLYLEPAHSIDQIIIYGRTLGKQHPDWVEQIGIPLDSRVMVQAKTVPSGSQNPQNDSKFLITNETLARSGEPEAIARHLSKALNFLGVSFKVFIQHLQQGEGETGRWGDGEKGGEEESFNSNPGEDDKLSSLNCSLHKQRLWVMCHSDYSPDPSLLAEPLVEQLRSLELQGFRDAIICSQVSGEAAPEWKLKVDLTPPADMLNNWASWGDGQAITRLLNQALQGQGLEVRVVLKEATLHIFCYLVDALATAAPQQPTAVSVIASVLELIAPQGITAATIFGVEPAEVDTSATDSQQPQKPAWVEWLSLPAAKDPALAKSVWSLAQQACQPAVIFLLEQLLNPNLQQRLATGGISLKIARQQDLLHIMSEAPVCPARSQVAPTATWLLRQLAIPEIAGVRVYGRRAGSSSCAWNYGVDFVKRRRLVPEATPEFAVSDVFVSELVAQGSEPILRPDLTKEELNDFWRLALKQTASKIRWWLCYCQLFVPTGWNQDLSAALPLHSSKSFSSSQSVKVAMVWGALGLSLTLIADFWIGKRLLSAGSSSMITAPQEFSEPSTTAVQLPKLSLQKSGSPNAEEFNASGFTKEGQTSLIFNGEEVDKLSTPQYRAGSAILAAARSTLPSFNNLLLNEKLALYQQRLLQTGPPDVLIIGSSRAMRGVDPQALQNLLAAQGYTDIEVFNFGVNGATAQVVEFVLRRILMPEQLPKLIIWADGARAFNSGREDITYQAIANSQAYQKIEAGTFPFLSTNSSQTLVHQEQPLAYLNSSYQSISEWLNQSLGSISPTYSQRQQFKSRLQEQLITILKLASFRQTAQTHSPQKLSAQEPVDFNGFLAVSTRFNSATYYQQHPRVAGAYDSNYQSFQLAGEQHRALKAILKFTQEQNISIVFVNLPLTKDYLDPVRSKYEEQFRLHMHATAMDRGLIFRDLADLLLTKDDYFSDPSHLNRYGAYQISKYLAQDPMIPWSLVINPEPTTNN
ncbi:MAG: DUF1574 domain-containing protein [Symploca sp. SIO3C6]|nr:DUF1574 domain-containing protein [Symploca sp. SIO3C6]